MTRSRTRQRSLTGTRIYRKNNRYYYFAVDPIVNPKTGRESKWHPLCHVDEGEDRARELLKQLLDHNRIDRTSGDLPGWMLKYSGAAIKKRDKTRPADKPKLKMHEDGNKEILRICNVISNAFQDFDVDQVLPVDIATFVDQWEGQRMAEIYLSRLTDFFRWCARKGIRADNPCREVKVEKTGPRKVYMTDRQYYAIYDALMIGNDGKQTRSGAMIQCYVDLCYLLYQRTTELRLLRKDQVTREGIYFKPTKTEKSSGKDVFIPMTPAIWAVIERASRIYPISSMYVIHTAEGQPFTKNGIWSAWRRACYRAEVLDVTMKDIRAKAATDAKNAGHSLEQLAVGLAHTSTDQTKDYIKQRKTPVSQVTLNLPARPSK